MANIIRMLACLICIVTLMTQSVKAEIIDGSLDGQNYITDTLTGYEWLDPVTTWGESYNYVESQLGGGGLYDGWRYATKTEVETLVSNAGVVFANSEIGGDEGG